MHKRPFFGAIAAISTLFSCGNGSPASPLDGGQGGDGGSQACKEAGTENLRLAANPTGTKLAAGDSLSVRGVTSDGYVVFSDDAASRLHVVSLSGGHEQDLGALGGKFWITVSGSVVFAWSNVNAANVGALSVWTAKTGVHSIAGAAYGLLASAAPDGSAVLYVTDPDGTGTMGNVSIAGLDGSSAGTLVANVHVQGCFPQLGFAGSSAVASHCDAMPSDSPSATISAFQLPGRKRLDLMTNAANFWSTSTTGADVLVATKGGVLLVPTAGGHAKTIDPAGFIGQLSADGTTAFYSTMSHAFRRSSVASPAPVTLVSDHFGGLYSLSLDERWALYYGSQSSLGTDLFLASAAAPATPLTLSSQTDATIIGDPFTADSSHVLFAGAVDPCSHVGAFTAHDTSGSGSVVLGHDVWSDRAAGGARVVFTDNYIATGGLRFGRADVEFVDLASSTTPTRIASRADAVVGLSPSGDQVIYSWSASPGARAGIYASSLPGSSSK